MNRLIAQRSLSVLSRAARLPPIAHRAPGFRRTPRLAFALSTSPRRADEQTHTSVADVPDWSSPKITYDELKPLTQQPSDNVVLIDVREPDEIAQGSIPSSVALPLSILREALQTPSSTFEQRYGFKKPGNGEQDVIFYCRSGKRSATACDEAVKQNWQRVKNYEGSWLDWVYKEGLKP